MMRHLQKLVALPAKIILRKKQKKANFFVKLKSVVCKNNKQIVYNHINSVNQIIITQSRQPLNQLLKLLILLIKVNYG